MTEIINFSKKLILKNSADENKNNEELPSRKRLYFEMKSNGYLVADENSHFNVFSAFNHKCANHKKVEQFVICELSSFRTV